MTNNVTSHALANKPKLMVQKKKEPTHHPYATPIITGHHIPVRLETTIRITFACFVSFVLAYIDLPELIPPSMKYMVGLFGPLTAMRFPTYTYVIGAMLPSMFVLNFFILASITALLSAATVSDAFFVIVCTLWAIWISGLRYGKLGKVTYILPGLMLAMMGLVGSAVHGIVTEGLRLTVPGEVLQAAIQKAQEGAAQGADPKAMLLSKLPNTLLPYSELILVAMSAIMTGALKDGPLKQTIPSGTLAGRAVILSLLDTGDLDVDLQVGGSPAIRLLWEAQGTENPLAIFRNMLIALCWAMFCGFIGCLLPLPWRTVRHDATKHLLPSALNETADYMQAYLNQWKTRSEEDATVATEEEMPASLEQMKSDLLEKAQLLYGGPIGLFTAFEPRLLNFDPRTCSWIKLKALMEVSNRLLVSASMIEIVFSTTSPTSQDLDFVETSIYLLRECAKAIETEAPINSEELVVDPHRSYADTVLLSAEEVVNATNEWIEAMHPTKPETRSTKNMILNIVPWVLIPMGFFARLVEMILMPLLILKGKMRMDWGKKGHYIKNAIGFVALMSLSIYWDDYRFFSFGEKPKRKLGPIALESADILPGSFSGWVLIAFAFGTMGTTEGTIKKCILRILGTFIGAFCGWLGLFFFEESDIGMVVWLTMTSAIGVYISVDDNRTGASPDYGYGGFYIVLTQVAIAMGYMRGSGTRDALVADRFVSNCIGIVVAGLLAVVPPTLYGGDPSRSRHMLREVRQGLKDFLKTILKESPNAEHLMELKKRIDATISTERNDVLYLMGDAKRMSEFPFFQVDPLLEQILVDMSSTASCLLTVISTTASRIQMDRGAYEVDDQATHESLERVLASLDAEAAEDDALKVEQTRASSPLASIVERMASELCDQDEKLNQVKWGPFERL